MATNFLNSYWFKSKKLLPGIIFTIPLFLIYEFGVITLSKADIPDLRNGADVLMRQILETFGIGGYHGAGLSYIIFSLVLIIYFRKDLKNSLYAGNIYFLMFLESLFWAIFIYGMLLASQVFLSFGSGQRLLQQIVLSIGAGLYEELVFRVFLIHGIAKILEFLFKWEKTAQLTGAIIISAIFFSGFHFIGTFGDMPSFGLFMARFVAGMVLGGIYVFRGFGIVAYAHSIYDLIILTQITQMN